MLTKEEEKSSWLSSLAAAGFDPVRVTEHYAELEIYAESETHPDDSCLPTKKN